MVTKSAQIHRRRFNSLKRLEGMLIHCNETVSFVANVVTASPLMTAGAKQNLRLL